MKRNKALLISSLLLFSSITACNNTEPSTSIIEKEIHTITLKSAPTKTTYNINETLDLTGTIITVIYKDNEQEDINVTLDMIKEVDMSTEGNKDVIITYQNKQTSFTITVIDTRQECPITFTGETEYIYDGNPKSITYTIPENITYTVEYQQNEEYYSSYDNPPKEIGTYALVIKTNGTNEYKPTTKWYTFKIVENKPEAEITFSSITTFTYDGESHSPTFEIENNLSYTVEYKKKINGQEQYAGFNAPTEIGNYILCVTVAATENTRATTRYCEFSIIENNINKITPTITFNFEPGTRFNIGTAPTYTITDTENNTIEDADVTILYTSDTTNYNSSVLPTTIGDYGITVTVNSSNKYNSTSKNTWFRITNKTECSIEFNGKNSYESGTTDTIEINVPNGVTYNAYLEKNETYYSDYNNTLPTEEGTYALIVETEENDTYDATRKWFIFTITAKEDENKITPTIDFNLNGESQIYLNENRQIEIIVPDGIEYTAHFEKNDQFYSNFEDGLPTETGYYALVVNTKENDIYKATSKYIIIQIIDAK